MPKLFPEKLNPAHDAAVRRMLAVRLNGRDTAVGKSQRPPAPLKASTPLFRSPPAPPRR